MAAPKAAEVTLYPRTPREWLLLLALLGFWASVLCWAVSSRAMWTLVGARLRAGEAHAIQARLFDWGSRPAPIVLIGDPRFIEEALPHLGGAQPLVLSCSYLDRRDVLAALEGVEGHEVEHVIIQNKPTLWANRRENHVQGPQPDLDLWRAHRTGWELSRARLQLFFRALRQAAQAPAAVPPETQRLANLDHLHFRSSLPTHTAIRERTLDFERVTWVMKWSDYDLSRNQELQSQQREFFAQASPEWGRFVSWDGEGPLTD